MNVGSRTNWPFFHRASRLAIAAVLLFHLDDVRAQTLESILEQCNEHLQAYANIEAKYREEVENLEPMADPPSASNMRRETREHHGIWDGERYRYDFKHRWEAQSGRILNFDCLMAFDQKESRLAAEQGGNISNRRITVYPGHRPHLLAMLDLGEMSIGDLIAESPRAKQVERIKGADRVTAEHLGEEVRLGLNCHKIECSLHYRDATKRYRFWVAPERNYLPIAAAIYFHAGDSAPYQVSETADWREIASAVWAPFSATCTTFKRHDDGKIDADPWFESKMTVASITLNPKHPDTFFSDVPMPIGVPIYYIEDGAIVREDYIEDPNAEGTPEERGLRRGPRRR